MRTCDQIPYSCAQVLVDGACNSLGQSRWVERFPSIFLNEYTQTPTRSWRVGSTGEVAGTVRTVGGDGTTAGNITFVTIHEAGHMVPYDKPEESLVRPYSHFLISSIPTRSFFRT